MRDLVVIGASAGGVRALQQLLADLPPDLDAAVLVGVHLSPDHPSQLASTLQRSCTLEVLSARDGLELAAGRVIVAVPGRHLLVTEAGEAVRCDESPPEHHQRPSHDAMLRSAAQARGTRVIGVILTGMLDDGAAGLRAVHEHGGACLVQEPDDSEYPDMPRHALLAVPTARRVPLAALAGEIVALLTSEATWLGSAEMVHDDQGAQVVGQLEGDLEVLLTYLQEQRGADFTGYKRPSLTRLIDRRMRIVGVSTYAEYVDRLQVEASELPALLDTLLINVTAMFRDPTTWDYLREELLPEALAKLGPDEPVRAWSAACASGEEAYSLAILLHQLLGDEAYKRRVKIYATDVDESALQSARAGRFHEATLASLTEQERQTYFEPDGDALRFRADLRPSLIFGRHDLLQDAPISRVLILSCRNVLMYFTPDTQTRVLERFPFALHEHGLLVLGKAEMLLTQSALFTPISLPHRVFRARRMAPNARLAALAVGGPGRDQHIRRVTEAAFVAAPDAQVVLDAHGTITLVNERAERSLRLSRADVGRAFAEVELSHRPVELRGLTASVQASGEASELRDVDWFEGTSSTYWDIRVAPLLDGTDVLGVHIVFTDVSDKRRLSDRLEGLNQELSTAYEELQSQSEELETTNEELQSAVEELETTNEELQSTNEELETMNEELQSTNEELQTLNEELRERTVDVSSANGFLHGILEGLELAVVVVDPDYRVQLWNGGAERLSGLRAFEVEGTLLLDVPLELPVDALHGLLRAVLHGAEQQELAVPVTNRFGKAVVRTAVATPLQQDERGVRGVVLTLDEEPA